MTACSMPLSIKDDMISFNTALSSNYSIHDSFASFDSSTSSSTPTTTTARIIHNGDQETRIKQLHNQVEQLSLSNARLVRANRILKLDCDRIVEEKTTHLKQALKLSVEQNIRLQRANRLLRDEYLSQTEELNNIKMEQIRKMTNVGPEYEYLVQVINLLYRQLAGKSDCETTCCFTEKPLHASSSLIVSPQKQQQQQQQDNDEIKHICRPEIKSHNIPAGGMASALEHENNQLRDGMDILIDDRDALYQLLKDKEEDNETLKYELKVKDNIVKQLENDFEKMELEVTDLQKTDRTIIIKISAQTATATTFDRQKALFQICTHFHQYQRDETPRNNKIKERCMNHTSTELLVTCLALNLSSDIKVIRNKPLVKR